MEIKPFIFGVSEIGYLTQCMVDRRDVLTSQSRDTERRKPANDGFGLIWNDDWILVFVEFVMRKNPSMSHSIHRLWCLGFPQNETNRKKSAAFKSHLMLFREVPHWIASFISNTISFFALAEHQFMLENISFWHVFPFLLHSSLRWHKSFPKPNGILQCFDEILWRLETIQRHNIWWRDTHKSHSTGCDAI